MSGVYEIMIIHGYKRQDRSCWWCCRYAEAAFAPLFRAFAVVANSNTYRINPGFRRFMVGVLVALGSSLFFVGVTLADGADDLQIVLTRESIRVGDSVLCSLTALETTLASESRKTNVVVRTAPDVDTNIHILVIEKLRTLGFESVRAESAGHPGWTLYPPQPNTEFHGCDQSGLEEAGEPENDS